MPIVGGIVKELMKDAPSSMGNRNANRLLPSHSIRCLPSVTVLLLGINENSINN